jgi:hypothetical protein
MRSPTSAFIASSFSRFADCLDYPSACNPSDEAPHRRQERQAIEQAAQRQVFKFRLELDPDTTPTEPDPRERDIDQTRLIPTAVKLAVWKRDGGRCVECGSSDNLHFDHIIPYSRGGSSLTAENIQLLCARHNLAKRDHIQ